MKDIVSFINRTMCNPCGTVIYKFFKSVSIEEGAPDDILIFNAHNNLFRNYKTEANKDFTIEPALVKNGGDYKLLITKTTPNPIEITLPTGSTVLGNPAATTITLTGANNEQFLIEFTHNGTGYVFWSESSQAAPAPGPQLPVFSPNVIPFINAAGEWAEDVNFSYQGGNLAIGANTPMARVHIAGDSVMLGNALYVQNLNNPLFTVGNDGYHAINTTPVSGTALTVQHPYPSSSVLYFIVDFKQADTRFTLDTDGEMHWHSEKLTTPSNDLLLARFSHNYQSNSGFAFTASGYLRFHTGNSLNNAFIGTAYDSGRLKYIASMDGGGNVGNPAHKFITSEPLAHVTNRRTCQALELETKGGSFTGTGDYSHTLINIKTSEAVDVDNPNAIVKLFDYNPTITNYNGLHYGLLIRPNALNGFGLGNNMPTATLHINNSSEPYNQLRLENQYTPPPADTNGEVGNIAYDDNNIYIKTTTGWKYAALTSI